MRPGFFSERTSCRLFHAGFNKENDMSGSHRLDPATEQIARIFLSEIGRKYSVVGAYVFGSQARGDALADSDTDVAVLLAGLPGDRAGETMAMADIAYELMLRTGIRIEPLPLWESEWEHPETFNNPALIANIRREGMRL
jgi:predicted nucleotidyltransferase